MEQPAGMEQPAHTEPQRAHTALLQAGMQRQGMERQDMERQGMEQREHME
jgi:hypothetical protein